MHQLLQNFIKGQLILNKSVLTIDIPKWSHDENQETKSLENVIAQYKTADVVDPDHEKFVTVEYSEKLFL